MYSILPLEAISLGFALPLVGILLSINRFIRLISNRWAGTAYERYGPWLPFVGSVLFGLLSTVVYGIRAGFIVFLLARIAWGISWSGLRQGGFVSTWSGSPSTRGRLTGLLWGIIRLGSAVGVVLGGALYDRYNFTVAVLTVAAIGLLAIPVAAALPWRPDSVAATSDPEPSESTHESSNSWRQMAQIALREPAHRWLSLSGFFVYLLGGIVISTTSLFIATRLMDDADTLILGLGVATLTGLLHGTRWITNLLVGPIVGAVSDQFGKSNTLLTLGALMTAALFTISMLPPRSAVIILILVLLLDGSLHVVINATASTVATETSRPHTFVAAFATMSDAGSAFGPIIAFSALAGTQLTFIYLATGGILLASLFKYWRADRADSAQTGQPSS